MPRRSTNMRAIPFPSHPWPAASIVSDAGDLSRCPPILIAATGQQRAARRRALSRAQSLHSQTPAHPRYIAQSDTSHPLIHPSFHAHRDLDRRSLEAKPCTRFRFRSPPPAAATAPVVVSICSCSSLPRRQTPTVAASAVRHARTRSHVTPTGSLFRALRVPSIHSISHTSPRPSDPIHTHPPGLQDSVHSCPHTLCNFTPTQKRPWLQCSSPLFWNAATLGLHESAKTRQHTDASARNQSIPSLALGAGLARRSLITAGSAV